MWEYPRAHPDGGDQVDLAEVVDLRGPQIAHHRIYWGWFGTPLLMAEFVFGELHRQVLRRRREWFQRMTEAYTACWWVPAEYRPTTDDAEHRIRHLRAHGPTPHAFTLREHYPPISTSGHAKPVHGGDNWLCPA